MKLGLIAASSLSLIALGGCQHPVTAPPVVMSAPPPAPPPPPPRDVHVYRLDFELTPKDPKDPAMTPITFTLNLADDQWGEVMVGRNVPLTSINLPPPPAGALGAKEKIDPITIAASPRIDVGMKVKAQPKHIANSEDLLLQVDLQLSSTDGASTAVGTQSASIHKVVWEGTTVANAGKPSLVASVDDDKRHYELTVRSSKLR